MGSQAFLRRDEGYQNFGALVIWRCGEDGTWLPDGFVQVVMLQVV